MARYDNYPDDIRCYDHDPRSPFYDNSAEDAAESALEDAAKDCPEFFAQCERLGLELTAELEADYDGDGSYSASVTVNLDGFRGVCPEDMADIVPSLARIDREHPDFADLVENALP